ncbi:sigma-70 family RNA polymerase sigma factor [Qiania dongpingensis]|uniref:Sigma-70 family RNA polymerase sigma factor n=1 Tax=Qiania dongpingensis TaxID=2763669 RepID=A0A7G9G472_9FIRM|nr:sigma-70 family RNA polymerase sigma factor [Qiania dongpingensis]QNM05604.1 sigma-70 family RNA polymerase sigma factor [Qiania dongpingensis]
MENSQADTLSLVKRAVRGNIDAYGTLITDYQDYLYRTAFLYVKKEDLALDVVGDCILKGFQSIHTLKKPEFFKTWLTRILIHCAMDTFHKLLPLASADTFQAVSSSPGISPEEKWDLYDAIDLLPEKHRTVIILKYFNDLTVNEIAYAMNIPEGSVKAYLSRARRELRNFLKEDYIYAT